MSYKFKSTEQNLPNEVILVSIWTLFGRCWAVASDPNTYKQLSVSIICLDLLSFLSLLSTLRLFERECNPKHPCHSPEPIPVPLLSYSSPLAIDKMHSYYGLTRKMAQRKVYSRKNSEMCSGSGGQCAHFSSSRVIMRGKLYLISGCAWFVLLEHQTEWILLDLLFFYYNSVSSLLLMSPSSSPCLDIGKAFILVFCRAQPILWPFHSRYSMPTIYIYSWRFHLQSYSLCSCHYRTWQHSSKCE